MQKKTFLYISILGISWWLGACKAPEISTKTGPMRPLPKHFSKSDTNVSAVINWRQFYTDTSLVALIDTAIQNNLDLAQLAQRLEMAQAQLVYANGRRKPFVVGGATMGVTRFGKYTMDGVGNFDTNFSNNIEPNQKIPEYLPDVFLGVQSNWEIDINRKLRNRSEAAAAQYLSTTEGRNFLKTNLVAQVAMTYYQLLALDSELEFIQENIGFQNGQLNIIKIEKEAGRSNELAVQQFEAQLLNARSLMQDIRQQIVETESQLNFLMGRYPQPIIRDQHKLSFEFLPKIQVNSPSDLLRNRADVRQAEQEILATKAYLLAARAQFLPSLNLGGTLGLQTFNPQLLLNPQSLAFNLLGGLMGPLVNKSAIEAEFRSSQASQIEALYQYQKTLLNAYAEVYNQSANIQNMRQLYEIKEQESRFLVNAVETASQLYLTGRASYLEVLLNLQNARKANVELIEVRKRQFFAAVNLYRALGGGWQ
jgi:outer membrane protein, multidrug efflux system